MTSRKAGLGRGLEALIPIHGETTSSRPPGQTSANGSSMFRLINPDGTVRDRLPVTLEEMKSLYADMVEARVYDDKSMAMQRQGRLATYAPFRGQEAAQIGAAAALRPGDWVSGTYRDAALNWKAGYPWKLLILGRTGDERGGQVPEGVNVMPPSITVGGHMIHAVGLAWAERLKGTDRIALTSFGDGATSEGDFHEAMNFAAVYETPTVFLCQNNGWAISYPVEEQTRSETIADKALAYGMPGVRVDGNDPVAVYNALSAAVERARSGGGPSLVECVTFRFSGHYFGDQQKYIPEEEMRLALKDDPFPRYERYLTERNIADADELKRIDAESVAEIEAAIATVLASPPPPSDELEIDTYADMAGIPR